VEKVVYLLRAGPEGAEALGAKILTDVAPALAHLGAEVIEAHANVVDEQVRPAAGRRLALSPAPADAVVSVWMPSAGSARRAPIDAAVGRAGAAEISAHLVTESVPLPMVCAPGARVEGMAQVAFLRRPTDLDRSEWLRRWLDEHTEIAIATQATFAYVQQVVVRHLLPGATEWHAIVEEGFPLAAMHDDHAFFDAAGDDERLDRHRRELFASVQRFVDLGCIDVLPTSHHRLG
jgi:hypothetical protein